MSAPVEIRLPLRRGEFSLDVDLELPGTGVTVLSGPSGAGKTSLLRAVAGLDVHEGGYLRVGENVWQNAGKRVPTHRRSLGYVFQEAGLFPHLTVRQNIEYGQRRAGKSWPADAIGLLGIGSLLERKPHTLSGGERQRVAVARALAVSPEILLMDEPLASLDAGRKTEVLPFLAATHAALSIPVLYVTHAPDEIAALADHLVLFADGGVLAHGPLAEILTRPDLPPARGRDAAAVLETTVGRLDEEFGLARLDFAGGSLTVVDGGFVEGERRRVCIAARDVSLALGEPSGTSILNTLPATVDSLRETGHAEVVVRLRAGGSTLLARVTRKSAAGLSLGPGMKIVAQVKSVAVLS